MKHGIVLCLILLPACLLARPKTDTITLVNGNLITGEILSMSRSYLSISTDSMGTLNVKWPDVTRVSSEHGYVVEDSDGQRYYGLLSSDTDKILQITDMIRGTHRVTMISVIAIYPSSRTLWRRFDGSLDVGYSFTKSNSRSQFNLSGNLRYRSLKWESQLGVESLVSSSSGTTDTDRDTVDLSAMRHFGSRWNLFAMYQYQHNLELGLSYRNSLLQGVARRFVQTDRTALTGLLGVAFSREDYTNTDAAYSGEAGLGLRYQFYKLYSPKLDISTQLIVSPSLTVADRLRAEFETECKIELIKDFFWSLSLYDSYDSKPPGELDQKHDYGVTTGIGWTFG
jgi:hypothetical protein